MGTIRVEVDLDRLGNTRDPGVEMSLVLFELAARFTRYQSINDIRELLEEGGPLFTVEGEECGEVTLV
jgi:hypothetical protein